MEEYMKSPLAIIRYWGNPKFNDPGCVRDIDFITELVHEIERLQTQVISLEDEIEFNLFADTMYRDGMADVYGDT
jgi:hypothetical protein